MQTICIFSALFFNIHAPPTPEGTSQRAKRSLRIEPHSWRRLWLGYRWFFYSLYFHFSPSPINPPRAWNGGAIGPLTPNPVSTSWTLFGLPWIEPFLPKATISGLETSAATGDKTARADCLELYESTIYSWIEPDPWSFQRVHRLRQTNMAKCCTD